MRHNASLTYSATLKQFFLLATEESHEATGSSSTLVALTAYGKELYTLHLALSSEATPLLAFDDESLALYLLNQTSAELVRIPIGADNQLDLATSEHFSTNSWQVEKVTGMVIDAPNRTLLLLDSGQQQLKSLKLTASGPDGASLQAIDWSPLGANSLRGLALDPLTHHLVSVSPDQQSILEISLEGQLLDRYTASTVDLTAPQQIVFAPSSDQTDAEENFHLFVIDSKQAEVVETPSNPESTLRLFLPLISQAGDQVADDQSASERLGELLELTLNPQELQLNNAEVNATTLQLIRTINTAAFSPPSPDPSGLTYLPDSGTLLMCDGEVEETVNGITYFAGANVWEVTLNGNVVRSTNISRIAPTSTAMTNEPTGVAWNPNNGHFYFSDDSDLRVYDLDPGRDGKVGTSDDSWSYFSTSSSGDIDPEGIAYDSRQNRIFVADGMNAEVYQYTTSGTLVGQFDVQRYGVVDPESVEYNSATGTLYVLSNVGNRIIVETTTSGTLLQTFNVSASNSLAPAGLAYAPASDGSGQMRFYIADRRVDNNSDARENDGRIYEMSAPQSDAVTTSTPTPTSEVIVPTPRQGTATPTPTAGRETPTPTTSSPSAGKVSITISEQSIPAAPQDFTYYSAFGMFLLDNASPDDGDGVSDSVLIANRSPGVYNVSQVGQSGWRLSTIQCAPSDKAIVDLANNNVKITASANDSISCTFVNESTSGAGQSTPTRSATPTSGVTPTSGATPTRSATPTRTPRNPTLTPTRSPGTATATPTAIATPSSNKASITIVEQALPSSPDDFQFYSAFGSFVLDSASPNDGDNVSNSITFSGVNPGSYNFSQVIERNWNLVSISCTPSGKGNVNLTNRNIAITVVAGDQVTCTFINSHN